MLEHYLLSLPPPPRGCGPRIARRRLRFSHCRGEWMENVVPELHRLGAFRLGEKEGSVLAYGAARRYINYAS